VDAVAFVDLGGEHQNRDIARPSDLRSHFLTGDLQCLGTAAGGEDLVALVFEVAAHEVADTDLVVDHQHHCHVSLAPCCVDGTPDGQARYENTVAIPVSKWYVLWQCSIHCPGLSWRCIMHNGNWNEGMGNGNWGWIPMMIMMVAFWGGLIWLGVTLLKRNHTPQLHAPAAPPMVGGPVATSKPTAQEILSERLARGEIETDDYLKRWGTRSRWSCRRAGGHHSSLRSGWRQSFENSSLSGPCVDECLGRYAARGIAQAEGDDHDVVERADHRKKLRDEVDG